MESEVVLKQRNPLENTNILSKIFLTWSFSLFKKGYKSGIIIEDLYLARSSDRSGRLGDRLEEAWMDEIANADRRGTKPSLGKAIFRCFWLEYILCGFIGGLLYVWIWPLLPYTLGLFIAYFVETKTPEAYRDAHIYSFILSLLSMGVALLINHFLLSQGCVGMRVRIACCSVMYRKILKLNRAGLNNTAAGQLINLMSNDVNRFDLGASYLNYLWVMPFSASVVCYLVWQRIAWATLAAVGIILGHILLIQVHLSNFQGVIRDKIAKRTDERVKVMSELVNGVQVIKMYAWEKPFAKVVDTLRKLEVKLIIKSSMIKGFSFAMLVITERTMLFVAVVAFIYIGGDIRAEITFSLAQYFNLLQTACMFFPLALVYLAESKVSIKRIEDFLKLEEIESAKAIGVTSNGVYKAIKETKLSGIILAGVSAGWQSDPPVDTLKNISLTITPGELIGVVGHVGSGKSSLLQLILGELEPSQGTVVLGGARVAYASQEPWLFVGSVKQNILFGLPYDRMRYKKVVTACALLRDFELLPGGDSTLVGERGISLSGGQRARIGLARACYRQADVYLLDDPLSAVDTHVGKHIVNRCVMGLLKHSTRILVTHQLHHLKASDKIVILRNGQIDAVGTFDEVSHSPHFKELIHDEESLEENNLTTKPLAPQRTLSIHSHTSTATATSQGGVADDREVPAEIAEFMEKGKVSASVYLKYFRAGGGWGWLISIVVANLLAQTITTLSDLWLTNWMNIVEAKHKEASSDFFSATDDIYTNSSLEEKNATDISNYTVIGTMLETAALTTGLTAENVSENADYFTYLCVWGLGILGCAIFTVGRSELFLWVCMKSSIRMHNQMFSNILAATMRFFDTNPSGRILNRFSKDMGVVDEVLPNMFMESIQVFMVMIGILVMVAIVSPFMLLTTGFCAIAMFLWTIVYLNTAQAIKRVEGVTRSPVFSHVSATMAGLSTVRACGAQQLLRVQFDDKQDVHTSAWYLTLVTNACFGLWLAIISVCYVTVASYIFLLSDDGSTRSGNVGLALSQGLILVSMVHYGVKQATEVISQMTCVERVQQYTSLPQEKTDGPSPPIDWPKRARLVFKDLYLRYDADAEPVLKNLNITIESGWKVGVVGRTGAGKSSLISALFRLAPTDGYVYIDDINIGEIALKELRSKISIIPQEPVLFSASLRYNMDPFDKYSDADIWKALEQVELKHSVTSLSSEVAAGGTNFSAGQRQLLCLARAALANNKLLVLDEATANVDPNTDALIQKSIRKHFRECTVITVAHRLHTVADSDRVVVMEAGQIVESGHPHELLQNEDGHFAKMVKQLGTASEQSLREIAKNAHALHTQTDSVQGNGV